MIQQPLHSVCDRLRWSVSQPACTGQQNCAAYAKKESQLPMMLGATQNIYNFDSLFPCVLLGTGILNNEICHFRFMVQRHLRGYSQLCFCLCETATLHQTLKLKILLAKIEKKKKKKIITEVFEFRILRLLLWFVKNEILTTWPRWFYVCNPACCQFQRATVDPWQWTDDLAKNIWMPASTLTCICQDAS